MWNACGLATHHTSFSGGTHVLFDCLEAKNIFSKKYGVINELFIGCRFRVKVSENKN